jgi:ArsR family transcriptional regulator, arsenate/arsenite/antimonite-responsive transcriptional repressor
MNQFRRRRAATGRLARLLAASVSRTIYRLSTNNDKATVMATATAEPSPESAIDPDSLATVAKALGHPARIRIVRLLLERRTCIGGDIVGDIGLAQSTVSEHLRILKEAGIIQGEIERPRVCYALRPESLAPLAGLLEAVAASRPPPSAQACS